MNDNVKRANVYIPKDVLDEIDSVAKELHLSRNAFMIQAASSYVTQMRAKSFLKEMKEAVCRIGTNGNNDAETLKQMESILALCNALNG